MKSDYCKVGQVDFADAWEGTMNYRLYLLDSINRIRAAESFSATGDREARKIAASVHEACADVFAGYEIWRGSERLTADSRQVGLDWTDWAMLQRQEAVLDLEERLQRTFACVSQSRRLLEASAKLRGREQV
ncbi:MAG: hypothetical protein JO227_22035 [Acetobacteraceae bacterium]|nr:hypothetical protein [Acetobacteraceae bacterium]